MFVICKHGRRCILIFGSQTRFKIFLIRLNEGFERCFCLGAFLIVEIFLKSHGISTVTSGLQYLDLVSRER